MSDEFINATTYDEVVAKWKLTLAKLGSDGLLPYNLHCLILQRFEDEFCERAIELERAELEMRTKESQEITALQSRVTELEEKEQKKVWVHGFRHYLGKFLFASTDSKDCAEILDNLGDEWDWAGSQSHPSRWEISGKWLLNSDRGIEHQKPQCP